MDFRSRSIITRRLGSFRIVAAALLLILVVAYGWIQLGRRSAMREAALSQAVKNRTTPAPRGVIYDRNGNKLVVNHSALNLVIQNEDLPSDLTQIEAVAVALGLDPGALKRKIHASRTSPGNRMVVVQDNLNETELAKAEMLRARYPFLSVEMAPRRVYLGNDLAGHVEGTVGEVPPDLLVKEPGKFQIGEIIGRSGFEAAHNTLLRGQDGQRRTLVDNLGRDVALFGLQEPVPGHNAYLTLDAGLQQVLKEALGTENGAGIAIDLRDGGILAMYSNPSFDPNIFLNRLSQEDTDNLYRNPARPLLNRVTQGLYPPGSTFKLLMSLAALEKGIINPNTAFSCHGQKTFYNRVFHCDAVHGSLDLVGAIAHSCNNYFWEVGSRMDIDDIYAIAKKYGLVEATGVDLPGEKVSRVPSREWKEKVGKTPDQKKWYAGETLSVAIGQGADAITPISLARFYGMIATKGKLLTPHLYYGSRDEQTGQMSLYLPPPPRDAGLDPKIWAVLDEGLYQVVKVGTAKASNIPGFDMCGKTGTAQVRALGASREASRTQEKKFRDNALFAGYAPRENPQIAFAIVMENAGFGASSAAPVAKKLCQYWFFDRMTNPRKPPPEYGVVLERPGVPKPETSPTEAPEEP